LLTGPAMNATRAGEVLARLADAVAAPASSTTSTNLLVGGGRMALP
jgi:hypothetical protein